MSARTKGRWRVGLAWGTFLAVCAGFFWLSTWVRPPRPGRLILMGAGYDTNLRVADNAAGFGGVKQLATWAEQTSPLLKMGPAGLVELRSDAPWEESFAKMKEPLLVVAISAHGGRDKRGPYLLPHDSDLADDDRQRVPIAKLLDQLSGLPATQKKLLVLDAAFMPSHAALGMLTNDFARGLVELEAKIEAIPNLVVLCSTSPDELSWPAPEWRSTAFAHFLQNGLHGMADLDGDRRIDVLELWQYTSAKLGDWAKFNRLAEQTPMLLPRGAEGERRARQILVSLGDRSYEPQALTEAVDSSPAVKAAWEKWAALQSMVPSPAVFAPYRWQNYQAGVLRVEQLLRLGDEDGAGRMQTQLDQWDAELRRDRDLPAPSLKLTWAMPEGDAIALDDAVEKKFGKIWDATKDEDADTAWDEWQKAAAKDPSQVPPRRELTRWVYDRVIQNPANLEKAGRFLRLLRDGSSPYPPEPQFALMLSRDVPANPPAAEFAATVPASLQVRRLAERTPLADDAKDYSYAERLDPWIGAAWLEVDKDRELGQDLMMTGSADDWKRGRERIDRAAAGYRQLQATAAKVRSAFAARDRVVAMLPFYATWALKTSPVNPAADAAISTTWQQWHDLDATLSKLAAVSPDVLAEKGQGLQKAMAAVENLHAAHVQKLRTVRVVDDLDMARDTLANLDAVLSVPFANRLDLVAQQATLSRLLLVQGQNSPPPSLTSTATQAAKAWGKRFGAVSLGRLGSTWFDKWSKPGSETFSQVNKRLDVFGVEEKWWQSAGVAGEQIGGRVLGMNDVLRRLTTLDAKMSAVDARTSLQDGDRIVRLADARTPLTPGKAGPATLYRRWLTSELLERQTERTWQGHWFDDNPAAEPYFRTVCRGHLLDVQNLSASFGTLPVWKDKIADWDKKLQHPGELVLFDTTGKKTDASGMLIPSTDRYAVLTSEEWLRREYRLTTSRPDDPTPGGLPVVWIDSFQHLTPLEPRERQRVVLPVHADRTQLEQSAPLACAFTSPLIAETERKNLISEIKKTSLGFKGLFRGQQIRLETRVEIQATPDVIARTLPIPEKSSVAVRTRRDIHTKVGSAQGAIVFLLDASGSMRPPNPDVPDKSRYNEALVALKSVISKLPKDTQISVVTFGQAMGAEKTVKNAEETIQVLVPPTAWDPLNPAQLDGLMARLAFPAVEPWNESPLARSLLKAKSVASAGAGYKAIVTITDGGDNRFAKDEELQSKFRNLHTFIKAEFDKGDVTPFFLMFRPVSLDEKTAKRELGIVEHIEPAGKVLDIDQTDELVALLEKNLKQRLNYFVDYQGKNVTVDDIPEKGLDISPSGTNYRWIGKGLKPGGHKLRVDVAGRVEKDIVLHRGDLLLADLIDTKGGYTFERFLFSSEFPWKRSLENGKRDWKMSVLQNQLGPRKDLEMLVTLEKTVDRRENILEQIKPRDAWIEVSVSTDAKIATPVRWSYLSGYPAPAWAVDAPDWPGAGSPLAAKVEMWWNPDEEARAAADLVLGDILDERDRSVFLPNEPPVTLESARIEKHYVEVSAGTLAPRTCVVVRLKHAPGRPVIARLHGMTPAGSEQRLYSQNDRTASLFWFEPDLDPKAKFTDLTLTRVRFISIAAFKEEARRRDYWLEIRDLPPPDPADERPRPPIELK